MADNLDEKSSKGSLKKIIENNNNIPYKAKAEIKSDNRIGTQSRKIAARVSVIYAVI